MHIFLGINANNNQEQQKWYLQPIIFSKVYIISQIKSKKYFRINIST